MIHCHFNIPPALRGNVHENDSLFVGSVWDEYYLPNIENRLKGVRKISEPIQ